jgi:hypothetical protein
MQTPPSTTILQALYLEVECLQISCLKVTDINIYIYTANFMSESHLLSNTNNSYQYNLEVEHEVFQPNSAPLNRVILPILYV